MSDKKLNIIIHMGDTYPYNSTNARRMRAFYDILTAHGHNIKVLAPRYKEAPLSYPDTYYCRTVSLKSKSVINRFLNCFFFSITSFFRSLFLGKADVVITTSPPPLISFSGWLIAKCKRAKLVYDVRDIWPDIAWDMDSFDKNSLFSRVFEKIRDFMLHHSDLVTAVSPTKVKKLMNYVPEAKIIEITNGLDEKFLQNGINQSLVDKFRMDEIPTCTYIGNIGLAQNLTQFIDLAQKAQENNLNVQFILFGGGVMESDLRKYAVSKGLKNVIFGGKIPNDDVYTILAHSKINFITLVNDKLNDSIPTKIYEALGVGCPVLLSASGDSVNVLNECKLGKAVPVSEPDKLWEAFVYMLNNSDLFRANSDYSRQIILERYSRQKAADKLEKELINLI